MTESHGKFPVPAHLADHLATGIKKDETVAQFELGDMKNFIYLILDWKTRNALIVDPQKDVETPLRALREFDFKLCGVLLTHTHHDHIAGVPRLLERYPDLPIWVGEADLARLDAKWNAHFRIAKDGGEIAVGELRLKILHTPGHSPGECCYFLAGNPPYLWTGDTIFIRDCGRTDLSGGNNQQMFDSLQRIRQLPAATVILPGHHYALECASTLEAELATSPPFQCKSVTELSTLP